MIRRATPVCLSIGALFAATVLVGCGCGASPVRPPEPARPSGATTTPVEPSDSSGAQAVPGGTDPLDPTPVLADQRLVEARLAAGRGDAKAEAEALGVALVKHAPSGWEAARWRYLLGAALRDAGDKQGAAAAFDAASEEPSFVLVDYARLQAGLLYAELGKHAEARERLAAISSETPIAERAALLLADELQAMGEPDKAADLWRAHLAGDRPRARWAEAAVNLASWLLSGTREETRAREAHALVRRVMVHAPASSAAAKAAELDRVAIAWLPADEGGRLSALDASDRIERAEQWAASGRTIEALEDASAAWKSLSKGDRVGAIACRAASLRAELLGRDRKKRDQAVDAWGEAVVSCAKDGGQLVRALYNGAKTQAQLGRATEALAWFDRVEKEFPDHRLADDARLRTARLIRGMQDEPRFVALLSKMADDYPNGDMLEDGLFELAFHHVREGRWAQAVAPLEKSLELRPREKEFWTGGRARYYLARAYEATGRTDDSWRSLERVVIDHPWSFYAVLALSRLQASAPGRARAVVVQGEAAERDGPLVEGIPPALQVPGFTRAVELLRLGENGFAKREIQAIAVADDDDTSRWTLSMLYARAGATQESYRLARAMTSRWAVHAPKGRWRTAWELAYPRPYLHVVEQESARSSVPIPLIYGIMREESAFDAGVVSTANAYGLMQLILPTAQSAAKALGMNVTRQDLERPDVNIALGTRELARLRSMFPTTPVLAIPSYNAGPGATERWLAGRTTDEFDLWVESIPYEETRGYTRRVVSSMAVYAWLYEPSSMEGMALVPLKLKM